MTPTEIRLHCISALAQTGVREPSRIIKDATELSNWLIEAAENDKPSPAPEKPKVGKGVGTPD